jgi:hypothetical protein
MSCTLWASNFPTTSPNNEVLVPLQN